MKIFRDKKSTSTQITCALCGNSDIQILFEESPWKVMRCSGCGFTFRTGAADAESDSRYVDPEYTHITWTRKPYRESTEEFITLYNPLLEKLEGWVSPGKLIDVGCGPGFMLEAAHRRGWEVVGVDPSSFAATHVVKTFGLQVIQKTFEEANLAENFFDAAVLMHAIEHLPDPVATLREVFRMLRPGGVLMIETPNLDCNDARYQAQQWPIWNVPEHTCLFNPGTLSLALQKAGFRILEIVAPVHAEIPDDYVVRVWAEKPQIHYVTIAEFIRCMTELPGTRDIPATLIDTDSEAGITRGEVAMVLATALGLIGDSTITTSPFADVSDDNSDHPHPAWRYISALHQAGIVKGGLEGTYAPDDLFRRNHLKTILQRVQVWRQQHGSSKMKK